MHTLPGGLSWLVLSQIGLGLLPGKFVKKQTNQPNPTLMSLGKSGKAAGKAFPRVEKGWES